MYRPIESAPRPGFIGGSRSERKVASRFQAAAQGSQGNNRSGRGSVFPRLNALRGMEKVFRWIKQWGGLRQFKLCGTEKLRAVLGLHVIAYNLNRLGNLLRPAMAAA